MDYFDLDYISSLFEEEPKPKILDITQNNNSFKLPINYIDEKNELSSNIYEDLELLKSTDSSNCLYDYVFENDNILGKQLLKEWSKHYTTNKCFLKDSQTLYDCLNIDEINSNESTK